MMKESEYTEQEWQREMDFVMAHGGFSLGSTIRCPDCKAVGFYSPRLEQPEGKEPRKYHACKSCGFWQEVSGYAYEKVGGEPYRCVMVHCAPCGVYDWKVPADTKVRRCSQCENAMQEVKWPTEDPSHPYNRWQEQIEKANL